MTEELWTNQEVYEALRAIDEASYDVSTWEADFFSSLFQQLDDNNYTFMSPKQREKSLEIIAKYQETDGEGPSD